MEEGSALIRSEKTKQLLMNTILRVLEQHGRLTYLELTYRMKFRKSNTITNYDRGRVIRYLLLSKKSESSTTRQLRMEFQGGSNLERLLKGQRKHRY